MLIHRLLYGTFVAVLAGSPILSLILVSGRSDYLNIWKYIWVGPVISLPLTMLIAKAFGPEKYVGYWAYLESFPGNSKARIITSWAIVSGLAVALGLALS